MPKNEIRRLYRGRYLDLMQRGHWEYVERHNCEGAVIVVPLTDEGKVILLEQYRAPMSRRVIEWPAGLVNDLEENRGEDWENAARRELLEETGYEAAQWKPLVRGPTSPGMSSEIIVMYLAQGLRKKGPGGGDHHEDIVVHEILLDEVDDWLSRQEAEGRPVDPKVYAGLYFLKKGQGR